MTTISLADQKIADLTTDLFDTLGASYESAFGHNEGLARFIARALKMFKPSSQILDVGCGTGIPVASTIARYEHHVTGIDIAPNMVALSQKAVPSGHFRVANVLDYEPRTRFDVVLNILNIFTLSREQVENTVSRKWADWVEPGGLLCIVVVALDSCDPPKELIDQDGMCVRGFPVKFMGHRIEVTLFSKVFWARLVEKAGFEIVHTEDAVFVPPAEADSDEETEHFIIARKRH
ncbi:MAG: hypothetical protein Q9212_004567 [Teloschistes hypoglaucus]